jgi:cation-transporting P-type ATPase E
VLAVVARPYTLWRVGLVDSSGLAYVVIFAIPVAQRLFMLDPSNLATTSMALAIGVLGAAIIEVLWWLQGAMLAERRRLWR